MIDVKQSFFIPFVSLLVCINLTGGGRYKYDC